MDGAGGNEMSGRNCGANQKQSGFTLVELLTVMVIMALLAGMLFPLFSSARAKARQASCASNLKNLTQAGVMYSQDYDGHYVDYGVINQNYLWNAAFEPYLKSKLVEICPDASRPDESGFMGSAHTAWTGFQYTASYGYNGYLYCNSRFGSVCSQAAVPTESSTVWIADSVWIDAWPQPSDPPCPTADHSDWEGLWRFCMDRHAGGINVAFVDSHVKYRRQEALNTLQFMPTDNPQ